MKKNNTFQKLYILTGGPGAGKTTLLEELHDVGFTTVPEEGRRIIKEQLDSNGNGLPWMNKELFAGLMFDASVETYQKMIQISGADPVFFDRGILDTIGYLKLEKIPVPKEMEITAREMMYNKNVFILPPWKEIYENDPERKQTLEVAERTFECMYETYREYGYHLIEVPKVTVEQRIKFILTTVETPL
ncbi:MULTISPECIES: AAA family ATPase [unclassified Chryseobacterium]|uniref:AAA family ATPase n=1 Tax=unclassified Chryseobacterium TaxID=2593645 RepID=UPI00100A6261|nr:MULTISPECIES: AAA family ATPase [unclassified Chryseobacterium]RXM53246.1 ATPase [Chryseobacterium sp. CH25]RXM65557.1 ATPase [Chryseobacterium sp. CH1]